MFLNEYMMIVGAGHAGSELLLLLQIWVKTYWYNEFEYCPDVMQPSDVELQGQIVREIDALVDTRNCFDRTAIQFKMLNKSKGPAWSRC
jgi:tRNA uridine 5-carboxymethylaminomethyl modification enzyme